MGQRQKGERDRRAREESNILWCDIIFSQVSCEVVPHALVRYLWIELGGLLCHIEVSEAAIVEHLKEMPHAHLNGIILACCSNQEYEK